MAQVQWWASGKKEKLMSSQSRMRALFKRLSRRLALPSVLMGLVVFSFTLLFFGAAVYTAALPSLVANAEQSDGAYAQIASGALLEALTETPGDDSSQGNAGTSSSHQGGVTSSGRVVSGVGGVTGGVSTPITSTDDSTEDSDHEGDSDKDSNATPPQDGGGEPGSGADDNEPSTPPDEDGPGDDKPDDTEKDQQDYEFLLAEFQAIDGEGGYIDQINACSTSFDQDKFAPTEVRTTHLYRCEAINAELYSHYVALVNRVGGMSSHNSAAAGKLIGMYRCLSGYLDTLSEAWTVSLSFEDPSDHVDEFMQPIWNDEVNGENKHLAEFNEYYSEFVL